MSDENENYADSSGRYDSEGFAWYPYDQMPNALTWGIPGGHTEKIFVGQIPYGFIALDLARLTSYLSGNGRRHVQGRWPQHRVRLRARSALRRSNPVDLQQTRTVRQ